MTWLTCPIQTWRFHFMLRQSGQRTEYYVNATTKYNKTKNKIENSHPRYLLDPPSKTETYFKVQTFSSFVVSGKDCLKSTSNGFLHLNTDSHWLCWSSKSRKTVPSNHHPVQHRRICLGLYCAAVLPICIHSWSWFPPSCGPHRPTMANVPPESLELAKPEEYWWETI